MDAVESLGATRPQYMGNRGPRALNHNRLGALSLVRLPKRTIRQEQLEFQAKRRPDNPGNIGIVHPKSHGTYWTRKGMVEKSNSKPYEKSSWDPKYYQHQNKVQDGKTRDGNWYNQSDQ